MTLDPRDLTGEVEWLLGTDTPEAIARRLDTTLVAIESRLRDMGRNDLAGHFCNARERTS